MKYNILLLSALLLLGGCASLNERISQTAADSVTAATETLTSVKPWQRGALAQPEMQFGYLSLDASIDDHIYFSKEATSGGRSFAGGGCGCN
jgi:uncharacterized protein YceK|tara:strand:+ start:741 stop:1016 length:276 start_codon:yes stop_codon:yes gene_type:complete